ncbi:MAG: hypothetical protein SVR08_12480, partial [Spirochaetota bacterium]|nr:hypothetical protein [Spirochaetota bacterium]
VRSNLVTLPVFDDSYINKYIKAIFRKTYYKIFPFDPDDPDFAPDPLWMPIVMESYEQDDPFYDYDAVGVDYGTYSETIVGAKEYFVMNPFGWTDEAVEYYLMMFPNN